MCAGVFAPEVAHLLVVTTPIEAILLALVPGPARGTLQIQTVRTEIARRPRVGVSLSVPVCVYVCVGRQNAARACVACACPSVCVCMCVSAHSVYMFVSRSLTACTEVALGIRLG
jgi:hypothetical protein